MMNKTNDNTIYPVEKIVKKRQKKNKIEYLVKWKNYDETHNSWEPEGNFLDKSALEAFNSSQDDEKSLSCESGDEKPKKPRPHSRSTVRREAVGSKRRRRRLTSQFSDDSADAGESLDDDNVGRTFSSTSSSNVAVVKRRPIVRGSFRTVSRAESDVESKKLCDVTSVTLSSNGAAIVEPKANGNVQLEMDDAKDEKNKIEASLIGTVAENSSISSDLLAVVQRVESTSPSAPEEPSVAQPLQSVDPPTLQVMVSDSELWLINERNTKQKNDENVCQSIVNQMKEENLAEKGGVADVTLKLKRRLDVVVTDVKAHDFSVVFKQCYPSAGFVHSPV